MVETADGDAPGQFGPAVLLDKLSQNHCEGYAVEGVIRGGWGCHNTLLLSWHEYLVLM
jgi:hypothetical protein